MNQCISICCYLPFAITNEINVQISSWAGEMKTAKMSLKPFENWVWKVWEHGRGVRHWPHWPWVGVHMNSLHELLNVMFESKPTHLLSQGTFLNIMENKLVGVYSKEVMTWVCAVWLKITIHLRSDVLCTGTEEMLRRCGRKIHKVIYENVISTSENCSMSRGLFHFLRCSFLCHLRRYFKMIKWHI